MPDLKARIISPVLAEALLAGSPSPLPHLSPRRRVRRRTTTAAPGLRDSIRTRWKPGTGWRPSALPPTPPKGPRCPGPGRGGRCAYGLVHPDGVVYHSSWRTPLFGVCGTRMEYEPR